MVSPSLPSMRHDADWRASGASLDEDTCIGQEFATTRRTIVTDLKLRRDLWKWVQRMGVRIKPSLTARWRVAAMTGLVTSTFSTVAVSLAARRIGRDIRLSWMEVATVLLRDSAVQRRPGGREVAAGILVHQFADFSWTMIFFGLGERWTWRWRPATVVALAPLWAASTAAAEYYLILPWLQPLLRMQAPYWIGLATHSASAAAYRTFYWLRALTLRRDTPFASAGRLAALVLGVALVPLAGLWALGSLGREIRWPARGKDALAFDRTFLRQMTAHHAVGVDLADLAAVKAERQELRMLGRLMAAEQEVEIDIQRQWWRSWFGGEVPQPSPEEHTAIAGMPPPGAVEDLAGLSGRAFEERFFALMIPHHEGAVRMCDEAWQRADDPRVRLLANQIRHAQIGQITRMTQLRDALEG